MSKPSVNLPLVKAAARDINEAQPDPLTLTSSNADTKAATSPLQPAKSLTADIPNAEGNKVTFAQATETVATKPSHALENGMIAQIGAEISADGQVKFSTTSNTATIEPSDITAAPDTKLNQTTMAVAASPVIQDTTDEPQPKFTATADGLMVNTLGSAAGQHAQYASAAAAVHTVKAPLATPPILDQVVVNIAKAATDGIDKINIKLKPATLGQIEVQLEIASDGRIHAVIAADKPETLDLLQRDARALVQALGDAGLQTDSGSLSFNLRGQDQQNYNPGQSFAGLSGSAIDSTSNDSGLMGDDDHIGAYFNLRAAAGGVDIRV